MPHVGKDSRTREAHHVCHGGQCAFLEGSKVMLHLQEVARKTTRTAESAHQKSHPEMRGSLMKAPRSRLALWCYRWASLYSDVFQLPNPWWITKYTPVPTGFWPPRAWLMQKERKKNTLWPPSCWTLTTQSTLWSPRCSGVSSVELWNSSRVVFVNSEGEMKPDDNSDCTFSLRLTQRKTAPFSTC